MMQVSKTLCSLALLLSLLAHSAECCVHLMGQSPDSLAPPPNGDPWAYGMRGEDWAGKDGTGKPWTCPSGKKQSPINLHGLNSIKKSPAAMRTSWAYAPAKSNGTNIQVFNNGHTIQIQWAPGTIKSNVTVPTAGLSVTDVVNMTSDATMRVKATPTQFHFHTTSEHAVDGHYYPLEMHIVHSIPQSELSSCPTTGCLMVTGMVIRLDDNDKDNAALKPLFDVMPVREGQMVNLPAGKVLDIQALLPKSKSYALYEGSLTTPPCTEGLLWHVFTTPLTISRKQYDAYSKAVGLKDCELKKTNATSTKSRRLIAGTEPAPAFVRGSYTGFNQVTSEELQRQTRSLLADKPAAANSTADDYTCKIVSFGTTNRAIQSLNGRTVRVF